MEPYHAKDDVLLDLCWTAAMTSCVDGVDDVEVVQVRWKLTGSDAEIGLAWRSEAKTARKVSA